MNECKERDGEGCPFSTADHKQRRQSNGVGNGLKRYCNRCSKNKNPRPEPARQHVNTAASTSEQPQQQQRRDMNSVLGARGYASFNKQIGDGRPVTGRAWDGIAGRAPPVDPPDPTQIDHDTKQDGGRRRRYVRQHIALRKLPFVAKLVHSFGSTTFTLGRQYVGKDAAREFLMNLAHVLRTWMNEQMRKSPTIGIMIDESTDIRKVKVATPQFLLVHSHAWKSVPHLLSFTGTEQYGAGGWEAQPREVWVMIRLKPIGSASTTSSSRKR